MTRESTLPGLIQRRLTVLCIYQVGQLITKIIITYIPLEFQHRFKIGLTPVTSVLEDTKVMFDVEVEDEEADVRWFHNDIEFRSEDGRLVCQNNSMISYDFLFQDKRGL